MTLARRGQVPRSCDPFWSVRGGPPSSDRGAAGAGRASHSTPGRRRPRRRREIGLPAHWRGPASAVGTQGRARTPPRNRSSSVRSRNDPAHAPGSAPGRARRPVEPARASMTSSTRKPSTPGSMISGSAPARRAMTGVPVASDSIATNPNGSGQPPSINVARAPANSGSRRSAGARRGIRTTPPSIAGWTSASNNACSSGRWTLAAMSSGRPIRTPPARSPRRCPSPARSGRRRSGRSPGRSTEGMASKCEAMVDGSDPVQIGQPATLVLR